MVSRLAIVATGRKKEGRHKNLTNYQDHWTKGRHKCRFVCAVGQLRSEGNSFRGPREGCPHLGLSQVHSSSKAGKKTQSTVARRIYFSCKMRLSALRLVLERKRALCSFGCLRTFTKWMFAGNLLRRMVRLLELSCFYLDEAGIRAICQERGIKQTE